MDRGRTPVDVGRLPGPVAKPARPDLARRVRAVLGHLPVRRTAGEIDGRVDEVWTHAAAIFFTFVGVDEGEKISGAAADVSCNAKDDTITGTMLYHLGDDLPFVWRRASPATKRMVKRSSAPRKKRK